MDIRENHVVAAAGPAGRALEVQATVDLDWHDAITEGFEEASLNWCDAFAVRALRQARHITFCRW